MMIERWRRARRGAVSVMFAASAIPMIGLVGLAVDFGIWNQTNATLSVAANVAALSAVKITANAQLAGDPNAVTEGEQAGRQWFASEVGLGSRIGTTGAALGAQGATVSVAGGATVTATVAYNGTVPSVFGGILFGISNYQIHGEAAAQVTSAPYLNVEILLDNSGSMEIGATNDDIARLQFLTPCSAGGAFIPLPGLPGNYSQGAGQAWSAYQISAGGNNYDGGLTAPFPAGAPYQFPTFVPSAATMGPSCQGVMPQVNGSYPLAGPPCAFACHWSTTGGDYFAIARSTSGTANPIVLRIDLVKAATNQVIQAMQSDNIAALNNLKVGIFTFADVLTQIYPQPGCTGTACEAGNDWGTAQTLVGGPPTTPGGQDTGIQPYCCADQGTTDIHDTMTQLSQALTPSGDGTTATTPRKVLFLVSDGMVDWPPTNALHRVETAIDPNDCGLFKSMGYTVYVVYTPYVSLMNAFYLTNLYPIVESNGPNSLGVNLQACASSPSDYITASSASQLNTALQTFLKAALNTPARFTM